MGVVADLLLDHAIMFLEEVESRADCSTFVVAEETTLVSVTAVQSICLWLGPVESSANIWVQG